VRLIGEALDASQDETPGANDKPVFGSKFEAVTTLARHSLSQAVRRIVADNGLAAFTPPRSPQNGSDYRAGGTSAGRLRQGASES
jgi:hypothetical protein